MRISISATGNYPFLPALFMNDGIIELDSDRGKQLGFTTDRFDGYLWKVGDSVYVSFIMSRQRGNFRSLVNTILSHGWTVKIPTPLGEMNRIVKKNGYVHSLEDFAEVGEKCDVWSLSPESTISPCTRIAQALGSVTSPEPYGAGGLLRR